MLFTFPSQYWFAIGLSGVFSLTGWAPQFHARFLVPRATQDTTRLQSSVVYGTITLYGRPFQGVPLDSILPRRGPTTPVSPRRHGFGLFRVRSPLLTESLFIFSSYGYLDVSVPHVRLPLRDDRPSTCRVAPFGNLRIKDYLHLPPAYRSLSRPSSPPRAKASTVCPCLLSVSLTQVPFLLLKLKTVSD